MESEPWFIDACLEMLPGEFLTAPLKGYKIFRYHDCWWIMWAAPIHFNLGREVPDAQALRAFLSGNMHVGRVLTTTFDGYLGPIP